MFSRGSSSSSGIGMPTFLYPVASNPQPSSPSAPPANPNNNNNKGFTILPPPPSLSNLIPNSNPGSAASLRGSPSLAAPLTSSAVPSNVNVSVNINGLNAIGSS